jgi:hypothetical protein
MTKANECPACGHRVVLVVGMGHVETAHRLSACIAKTNCIVALGGIDLLTGEDLPGMHDTVIDKLSLASSIPEDRFLHSPFHSPDPTEHDHYGPKRKEDPKPKGFDHTQFSRRKRR